MSPPARALLVFSAAAAHTRVQTRPLESRGEAGVVPTAATACRAPAGGREGSRPLGLRKGGTSSPRCCASPGLKEGPGRCQARASSPARCSCCSRSSAARSPESLACQLLSSLRDCQQLQPLRHEPGEHRSAPGPPARLRPLQDSQAVRAAVLGMDSPCWAPGRGGSVSQSRLLS